jgi:hypothetical protein
MANENYVGSVAQDAEVITDHDLDIISAASLASNVAPVFVFGAVLGGLFSLIFDD